MQKFGKIVTVVLITAGTGWISFGHPSYLHAQDVDVKVETKPERRATETRTEMQTTVNPELQRTDTQQREMRTTETRTTEMRSSEIDQASARRVIAQATKAALGPNALQQVSELLVSSDRDRVRSGDADTTQLEATAAQLRNDWKAKYGSDFTIADPDVALDYSRTKTGAMAGGVAAGDATVVAGANSGPMNASAGVENRAGPRREPGNLAENVAATGVPTESPAKAADPAVPQGPAMAGQQKMDQIPRTTTPDESTIGGSAQPAAGRIEVTTDVERRVNANTTGDRLQGTRYTIPASHGMPATSVPLAREGDTLKIDLNDNVDGNRLASNLNRHLQMVSSDKANWPSDQTEAQRILAHHVAAALSERGSGM